MSTFRKCDICKKEISYGVDEKARGLIWGKYYPPRPGVKPHVAYIEKEEDIKLDDVCPDCMDKIMETINGIKEVSEC